MPPLFPDFVKILFIGDTFGRSGRRAVARFLPNLRTETNADFVILNAENLAGGNATNEKTLREMEAAGVDFFTGGNHSFSHLEIFESGRTNLIRPANMRSGTPGVGFSIVTLAQQKLAIINLLGNVFLKIPTTHVFDAMEDILRDLPPVDGIFVDFHAEATSEKSAFFWNFCGRVSAIIGTHTHVPTADARLSHGTFFQTDIGMTGPRDSVIGLEIESGIQNFLSPVGKKKIIPSLEKSVFRAIFLEISEGKTHAFQNFEFFENDE